MQQHLSGRPRFRVCSKSCGQPSFKGDGASDRHLVSPKVCLAVAPSARLGEVVQGISVLGTPSVSAAVRTPQRGASLSECTPTGVVTGEASPLAAGAETPCSHGRAATGAGMRAPTGGERERGSGCGVVGGVRRHVPGGWGSSLFSSALRFSNIVSGCGHEQQARPPINGREVARGIINHPLSCIDLFLARLRVR